jgi:hypothetical protein
MIAAA